MAALKGSKTEDNLNPSLAFFPPYTVTTTENP